MEMLSPVELNNDLIVSLIAAVDKREEFTIGSDVAAQFHEIFAEENYPFHAGHSLWNFTSDVGGGAPGYFAIMFGTPVQVDTSLDPDAICLKGADNSITAHVLPGQGYFFNLDENLKKTNGWVASSQAGCLLEALGFQVKYISQDSLVLVNNNYVSTETYVSPLCEKPRAALQALLTLVSTAAHEKGHTTVYLKSMTVIQDRCTQHFFANAVLATTKGT